ADGHQIEQVLMNLVQNARQAITERKDGPPGEIHLRSEHTPNLIRISVIDNGPGIQPQNMSKIFDPFFTTKPFGVGTGLGLSICYSILKEHGGNLLAHSEPGKGATFTMEIPVVAEARSKTPSVPVSATVTPQATPQVVESPTANSPATAPIPQPIVLVHET